MSLSASLADGLSAIVGPQHVLTKAMDMQGYAIDGRGVESAPLAVVRPSSREEIAALIAFCAQHNIRLVPQGARSGLTAAAIADQSGGLLLLNLDRLSAPPEIDPINRTAKVDAGTRLSTLNQVAAEHGLFFPIDLGADPSIGGMVATNTGGARFLRYGDVRRNVLAVDVITAEPHPRTLHLGSALWKDNSALDLKQIFVGSGGAFGIITGATLALSPKPAVSISALIALEDAATSLALLTALEASFGTLLTAFEGMSRPAMTAALAHVQNLRRPFADIPPYAVLIELSGGQSMDAAWFEERLAEALTPMLEDGRISDIAVDRGESLFALRHAVPEGLRASGKVVGCDISLRRGDVFTFRDHAARLLAEQFPTFQVHDFGHIGDGGLHYNLVWPTASGPLNPAHAHAARTLIFDLAVQQYGGSFSAEHGIGPINFASYEKYVPSEVRSITHQLRKLLAPLAMGRIDY
jgi:FAD/FMN-containing dehydrogenase